MKLYGILKSFGFWLNIEPLIKLKWIRHTIQVHFNSISRSICKNVYVDPAFRLMRFSLDGELDFDLKMILFIKKKWLGVVTYFCFIFKRVNKIRKKTINVTPYFGKGGLWKTESSLGLGYLSGRYGKDRSTPLSP